MACQHPQRQQLPQKQKQQHQWNQPTHAMVPGKPQRLAPTWDNPEYPFSSAYPGLGHGGSRLSRALQASFSPVTLSSSSWEAFPGHMRYIIPPAGSGSAAGSPPSRTCLENLSREVLGRHPDQMPEPPQLTVFDADEQRLYSELPPDV